MLIFGTDAAMLKFVDGHAVKVGQDFTVVAVSDLGLGNNDSIFNKGDAVALSNCNGVTLDWSLTGMVPLPCCREQHITSISRPSKWQITAEHQPEHCTVCYWLQTGNLKAKSSS